MEGSEVQDAEARFNSVDDKFFEVFGVRFLAGRSFDASDFGPGRTAVIPVNRSFVTEVRRRPLPRTSVSADALGRRIRYRDRESPAQRETALVGPSPQREGGLVHRSLGEGGWHEIVGVVEDLLGSNDGPTIFHPMTAAPHPASLTIRAAAGIGPAAGRLREVASGLDSHLRVGRLRLLDERDRTGSGRSFEHMFGFMVGAVTVIVLLLFDGRHVANPHGLHRRSTVA